MAVAVAIAGRVTPCDYTQRHPRTQDVPRTCVWVKVEGWSADRLLCAGCREYLRTLGKTVVNVDPDHREVA